MSARAIAAVHAAERRVDAAQREFDLAVLAARAEGMTLVELAEALGVSHQAIAKRLARAQARVDAGD